MARKKDQLLQLLLDAKEPQTANDLASKLSVSVRSIRNYIVELNQNKGCIQADKNGYYIRNKQAQSLLVKDQNHLPESFHERSIYMLKLWLIERTYYDIYTLAELMCVSDTTLRSDLVRMNKLYQSYELSFRMEHDYPQLIGSEKNRRRLISHIINEESSEQFLNMNILRENFPNMDLDQIANIIRKVLTQFHYESNDFSYMNIVMHMIIMLNRIYEGRVIESIQLPTNEPSKAMEIATALAIELSEQLHITINQSELKEMYYLMEANVQFSFQEGNYNSIVEMSGSKLYEELLQIMHKVQEHYHIDLHQDAFFYPFLLHVKNLLTRAHQNAMMVSPMKDSIQTSFPFLHDVSIFIIMQLETLYQVHILEDELCYITIHLGSEIERQNQNKTALKCVLLCPNYRNTQSDLLHQIQLEFHQKLQILYACSTFEECQDAPIDFLLTTIPLHQKAKYPIYEITCFLTMEDKLHIFEGMNNILENQKKQILKQEFHKYFHEDLFFLNPNYKNEWDCIYGIGESLSTQDYVEEDYASNVWKREQASSTCFKQLALPHSLQMDAHQSAIGVASFDTGIPWGEGMVDLVLMIAIAPGDKLEFQAVYEALTLLFSNPQCLKLLKKAKTFAAFKDIIFQFL